MKLLHIHREILELAAETFVGPSMPPPIEIERAVATLIDEGLLIVTEGAVGISPTGLAILRT
jgi:hypothetical protein